MCLLKKAFIISRIALQRGDKMSFPYPMRDLDRATITLTQGTDINGLPNMVAQVIDTPCTFQQATKSVINVEGKQVTLAGLLFKKGDLFTGLSDVLEGSVTVNGRTLEIYSFQRIKDPFNNVHHIEIEVM